MQKASLENTKKYLSGYSNVYFYKGQFPQTAATVKDKKFAFVHLDVNLYKSTLDGLIFFYPRMLRDGIILSYDYSLLYGVRRSFDEFFNGKPEVGVELSTTQCLVVKL